MSTIAHRARRRDLALLWHQVRYEQLSFWRNPQSAFFTFVFPVVIITLFGALFHGVGRSSYFYGLSALQYYVPTIAAVSVLGACYSQLAIVLSTRRQNGILKRIRATPLPAWTYFLGLLAHCIVVSVVDIALIVGVGALFGVPLLGSLLLLALLSTLFITTNLSVGYTFSTIAQNQLQAMQMSMMFFLPNILLSGFMFPFAGMPGWAQWIGELLPLTHYLRIVRGIMLKGASLADLDYDALALAGLMLVAMVIAISRFRRTLD